MGIRDRKWPLVTPKRRWEDNIKMYLQDVGWKGMDCILLAQDWDRRRGLANAEGGTNTTVTPEMRLEMNEVFMYSWS